MNTDDWLASIPNRTGSTPGDIETAKSILAHETLPAELAESEGVQRLVELDVLEIRLRSGGDDYEYRPIAWPVSGARWPL